MNAAQVIMLIDMVLTFAMRLQAWAQQIYGEEAIPSWEELLKKNAETQAKIDA